MEIAVIMIAIVASVFCGGYIGAAFIASMREDEDDGEKRVS